MTNLRRPRDPRQGGGGIEASLPSSQPLDVDVDSLREELQRLSAANQQILEDLGSRESIDLSAADPSMMEELLILRDENARLRSRIEEMDSLGSSRGLADGEDSWDDRQQEYEKLLEEKSEFIRALHLQNQELKTQLQEAAEGGGGGGSGRISPKEREEIQRLQREIEDGRKQLEDDEKALLDQARQMEMAMSKDRAELARQRNELQRLHSDLNREIEMAGRDPMLRDRLMNLQRRQQDMGTGNTTKRPTTMIAVPDPTATLRQPANAEKEKEKENGQGKSNGLLRRFFS